MPPAAEYVQMTFDASKTVNGFMRTCEFWAGPDGKAAPGTYSTVTDASECAAARTALKLRGWERGAPGGVDSPRWRPYGCMLKTTGGGRNMVYQPGRPSERQRISRGRECDLQAQPSGCTSTASCAARSCTRDRARTGAAPRAATCSCTRGGFGGLCDRATV